MAGGYLHPAVAEPAEASRRASGRFNAELARRNTLGDTLACLCAPVLGAGLVADLAGVLAVSALASGVPAKAVPLAAALAAMLKVSGRGVTGWDDAPHADLDPVVQLAESLIQGRLPVLHRLGI